MRNNSKINTKCKGWIYSVSPLDKQYHNFQILRILLILKEHRLIKI